MIGTVAGLNNVFSPYVGRQVAGSARRRQPHPTRGTYGAANSPPAPAEGVQVAKGPCRHPVPETVVPAPEDGVHPVQQVGEGLVRISLPEHPHFRFDRARRP